MTSPHLAMDSSVALLPPTLNMSCFQTAEYGCAFSRSLISCASSVSVSGPAPVQHTMCTVVNANTTDVREHEKGDKCVLGIWKNGMKKYGNKADL